jgi:hypothetical protein
MIRLRLRANFARSEARSREGERAWAARYRPSPRGLVGIGDHPEKPLKLNDTRAQPSYPAPVRRAPHEPSSSLR